MARSRPAPRPAPAVGRRHRDYWLALFGVDLDDWTHPVVIRFTSAYLDQGLAHWAMPGRDRGMFECFIDLYGRPIARLGAPWASQLARVIADDRDRRRGARASLARSLDALGVAGDEWQAYLAAEAQALRGWAGMVRQLEERPDRVPARALPARLVDFLAIRLLLSRAAAAHACRRAGLDVPLDRLRAALEPRLPPPAASSPADRAWPIFHIAQLCGLAAGAIDELSDAGVTRLEEELEAFGSPARRRLLHQAFERHLRHRFFDALAQHPPQPPPPPPAYQAVFCLDEREESLRRHLEEVDPGAETLGAAGFFGVAMYFRSATDAHARPLCPVAITPRHYVGEVRDEPRGLVARWARA